MRFRLDIFLFFIATVFFANGNLLKAGDNKQLANKPSVKINPVIVKSNVSLPWSFEEEFAKALEDFLLKSNKVQLFIKNDEGAKVQKLNTKNAKINSDYVVTLELLNHNEVPYNGQKILPIYPVKGEKGSVIMLKMRVKIEYCRNGENQLVLQEMIKSNHMVKKINSFLDYNLFVPYTTSYNASPMGNAHGRLAKTVANHIDKYVLYNENKVFSGVY